jgi:hypothetical protein
MRITSVNTCPPHLFEFCFTRRTPAPNRSTELFNMHRYRARVTNEAFRVHFPYIARCTVDTNLADNGNSFKTGD